MPVCLPVTSEYEENKNKQAAINQAKLIELGLGKSFMAPSPALVAAKATRAAKAKATRDEKQSMPATRFSARAHAKAAVDYADLAGYSDKVNPPRAPAPPTLFSTSGPHLRAERHAGDPPLQATGALQVLTLRGMGPTESRGAPASMRTGCRSISVPSRLRRRQLRHFCLF